MPKTIESEITFLVPARVLYKSFLDSQDLSRMALAPCSIHPTIGGDFMMFNGGVTGKITALDQDSKISEDWRFSQWEENVFSRLELSFIPLEENRTKLVVKQSDIPDTDRHGNGEQDRLVLNGWKDKFFMSLEKVIGFTVDRD